MSIEKDLAYIAGFIDVEGCITISNNGSVSLGIVNTSLIVLEYIVSIIGGSLTKRTQIVNKPQYVLRWYGDECIEVLSTLLPYLIEKKPQATTILEYFELRADIKPIRIPGKRGAYANPDREILIKVFQEILTELKLDH